MVNIFLGELFKFYKRRLFTVAVSIVLLVSIMSFYVRLNLIPSMSKLPPTAIKELQFPRILFTSLEDLSTLLLISSFIIICVMMGSEYANNTFKTISMRGTSRINFLNSKILATITFISLFALFATTLFCLLSFFDQAKIKGPVELEILSAAINPFFVLATFGVFILSILPYIGLGMFMTLLTKSSGASIAMGFVYFVFVEGFLNFLFSTLSIKFGEWLSEIPKYFLGGQLRTIYGIDLFLLNSESDYISQIYKAVLISLAYALVFYFASLALVKKRDILS